MQTFVGNPSPNDFVGTGILLYVSLNPLAAKAAKRKNKKIDNNAIIAQIIRIQSVFVRFKEANIFEVFAELFKYGEEISLAPFHVGNSAPHSVQ
jgi:hypothetical protein